MPVKIRVLVKYFAENEKHAKILEKVLSVENRFAPEGIDIETRAEGDVVITEVESTARVDTLISTIDDLVVSTQLINDVYRLKRHKS
ncbi:MAG: KEOPS complex subunit Pcc1 [Candidatus Baldrarchaeia archaeon]